FDTSVGLLKKKVSYGRSAVALCGLPERRQKYFGDQHAQLAAAEAGASGPELGLLHLGGQPGVRVAHGFERAAGKGLVAEQQFAQRAAAQALQIEARVFQGTASRHAAGEHPWLAMPAQI